MKKLVIKSTLIPLAILAQSSENLNATIDPVTDGLKALNAIQSFMYTLQFNMFTVGGAKQTMTALYQLQENLDILAASGYAAVFPE